MNASRFLTAGALVAALVTGFGCHRNSDVKKAAEDALDRAQIQHVNLDWDSKDRVMHMKGSVDNDQVKAKAEQVVTEAIGSQGKVANELTLKGADARTADNMDGSLKRLIGDLYDQDASLKQRNIKVDVNNGVVTLTGTVASSSERQRAYDMASKVPGVKEVVNSIQVNAAE